MTSPCFEASFNKRITRRLQIIFVITWFSHVLLGGSFLVIYYIHLLLFKTHFHTKCLITSKGYYKVIVLHVHAWVIFMYIICFLHTLRYNSSMRFGNDLRLQQEKWRALLFSIRGFFYDPRRNWSLSYLEVGIMNCGIRSKQIRMCKLSIKV